MLSDAVAERLIAASPAQRPGRGRHGRRALKVEAAPPKHLEPVEARALLAATDPEHRAMILMALSTGFRRGEVKGVRWENLQFGERRVELRGQEQRGEYVPCKCGSERDVVLYSGLARELGKRRQAEGYVFSCADGKPLSDAACWTLLRDA
jgi:integrase